jgi:hypothetical protein
VTEILPQSSGVAFAKEARDLLIECCVEFITLVSSEANEISEKEAKKTIACDHITKALEQLGFSDYVPAVLEAAAEHKEVQKVRCVISSRGRAGMCYAGHIANFCYTGPREEGEQVRAERHDAGGAGAAAGGAVCRGCCKAYMTPDSSRLERMVMRMAVIHCGICLAFREEVDWERVVGKLDLNSHGKVYTKAHGSSMLVFCSERPSLAPPYDM